MTRQARTPNVASARPQRTPVARRNRLSLQNRDPDYQYRYVNDTDDRINEFLERGYEFVDAAEAGKLGDKRVDNPVAPGSKAVVSVGQGTKAYLMRIKKEYFEEDQAAKQAEIDALERTMNKNRGDYGNVTLEK